MDGFYFGAMLSDPFPAPFPLFVAPSGNFTDDFRVLDRVSPDVGPMSGANFFGGGDFGGGASGGGDSGDGGDS